MHTCKPCSINELQDTRPQLQQQIICKRFNSTGRGVKPPYALSRIYLIPGVIKY